MKNYYQFLSLLLYIELSCLGLFYLWSPHGVQAITKLQREHKEVDTHLARLQHDITQLEREILQWESSSFYKEKIARERLQMARRTDTVYLLTDATDADASCSKNG